MIESLESRRLLSSAVTVTAGRLDLTNNKLVVSNSNSGVVYTYVGDADLDGKIDADDYFQIDANANSSADFKSADFNYDGKINADDYFLIDSNYAAQSDESTGGVSAVGGNETDFSGTAKNDRIYISNYAVSASVDGQMAVDDSFLVTINGQQTVTSARNLRINANAGDDYVSVNLDANDADVHITIYGAAGNDTIIGGAEADRIFAGDGNDSVCGGDGKDTIYGEAGDDSLRGGGANDLLDGGDGADTLRGDAGNDNLSGGANSDRLRGSAGNDTLSGGGGSDMLAGEAGNDSLLGGAGSDKLDGGAGADFWDGGSGYDYIHGEAGDASTASVGDDVQIDSPNDPSAGWTSGAQLTVSGASIGGASIGGASVGGASISGATTVSSIVDAGGLTKLGSGTLTLAGTTSGSVILKTP